MPGAVRAPTHSNSISRSAAAVTPGICSTFVSLIERGERGMRWHRLTSYCKHARTCAAWPVHSSEQPEQPASRDQRARRRAYAQVAGRSCRGMNIDRCDRLAERNFYAAGSDMQARRRNAEHPVVVDPILRAVSPGTGIAKRAFARRPTAALRCI